MINTKGIDRIVSLLQKKYGTERVSTLLKGLAEAQLQAIKERTARGVDYQGIAFKPYTTKYAAFLLKHGDSSSVDLRRTGKMLGALKVIPDGLVSWGISFDNTTHGKLVLVHNDGRGRMPERKFVGFGKEDQARMLTRIRLFVSSNGKTD